MTFPPPPPLPVPVHPCRLTHVHPPPSPTSQLSEKLDSVRERAGTVLQKLVQSNDPQIPFVPERRAVQHAITHGAVVEGSGGSVAAGGGAATERQETVNWASPGTTFPMVVGLLAVPEYHNAIGERQRERSASLWFVLWSVLPCLVLDVGCVFLVFCVFLSGVSAYNTFRLL